MYAMIDTCLFSLREERLDESGNPFILCIDQVNDQDVLSDATAEERKKAVEIAIHRMVEKNLELKTVFFEQDDPESLENVEYFFAAAVSFAIITGGFDLEQAQILVEQAIRVNLGPSVTLTPTLEDAIQKICMKFLAVAYAPREPRVFKPFEDLADVISATGLTFNLDNKDTYRSEAELGPVLDIESLLQISPLLQATHISREEMIVQARKFAYDYLGFPLGSLENARPPSHFTESKSNDNGILSREFLVYFNNYQPNLSQSDGTHRSGIVADIESQSEIRFGWFLIRLSDSTHPRITFYTKLTN
ncbi:MAG: hypothetical protein WAU07_00295, partial [Microgenomates group bacterium]